MRQALCQVLTHGDERPTNCESSCPATILKVRVRAACCLHYIYYTVRIKKHLHNQIEKIEIERQ